MSTGEAYAAYERMVKALPCECSDENECSAVEVEPGFVQLMCAHCYATPSEHDFVERYMTEMGFRL